MSPESDIITIEVLGTRLQLRGGDKPEAVQQAGEYVRELTDELSSRAPTAPPLQIALLVAMNLADELHQLTEKEDKELQSIVEIANRILEKATAALS